MAQLQILLKQGHPGIFLLDDFMTDFDHERSSVLLEALAGLGTQLIFTSPATGGFLADRIVSLGGQVPNLTY
jgi:recombinational DNA repair ATPase RecF